MQELKQAPYFEICLDDLRFYSYHGVMNHEKEIGNAFKVSLKLVLPSNSGIKQDRLESTVSYADVYEIVKAEMRNPRNLLEKVALEIAEKIKSRFRSISAGEIKIEKEHPPIPSMIGSASVILHF